jgi:hypothetical protein
MVYYDHAMLGATVAVAVRAEQRFGRAIVPLAALAGMFPDWDALAIHVSPEVYHVGHRAWGHNLFAVTLAGLALGWLGFLIHQSVRLRREPGAVPERAGPWILLAVIIMWTHPLLDVLYCGRGTTADWPVELFWPVTVRGIGVSMVPWGDWGATAILFAGLSGIALLGRRRQSWACLCLGVLVIYVGCRGVLLRWG